MPWVAKLSCPQNLLELGCGSASAPGKLFAPTLSMQAQRPPILNGVKREGRRPIFEPGSYVGLRVRSASRRNTTASLRFTSQDTRVRGSASKTTCYPALSKALKVILDIRYQYVIM